MLISSKHYSTMQHWCWCVDGAFYMDWPSCSADKLTRVINTLITPLSSSAQYSLRGLLKTTLVLMRFVSFLLRELVAYIAGWMLLIFKNRLWISPTKELVHACCAETLTQFHFINFLCHGERAREYVMQWVMRCHWMRLMSVCTGWWRLGNMEI